MGAGLFLAPRCSFAAQRRDGSLAVMEAGCGMRKAGLTSAARSSSSVISSAAVAEASCGTKPAYCSAQLVADALELWACAPSGAMFAPLVQPVCCTIDTVDRTKPLSKLRRTGAPGYGTRGGSSRASCRPSQSKTRAQPAPLHAVPHYRIAPHARRGPLPAAPPSRQSFAVWPVSASNGNQDTHECRAPEKNRQAGSQTGIDRPTGGRSTSRHAHPSDRHICCFVGWHEEEGENDDKSRHDDLRA